MPRRPRRGSNPGRGRTWLVIGGVVLFILITSLRGIASFYTDYLWFDSLGRSEVWQGVLGAKIVLSLIFTGAFFLLMWANLVIADRLAPPFRPAGPEEEFIERYHELVGGRMGLVRVLASLLLALIAGAGVSSEWNSWLLFTHGGDFGIEDPQFGTDVGFYVFKLPFLSFVTGWLFAALLIVLIVTTVAHYLNGGIRMSAQNNRVTPQVKAHLSVLLGLLALVKAAGYWLQRFDLTVSPRGFVDGAGYTDVKAQLPAINLLLLISIASFLLFIINIWRRGWTLPILGVGLWALVAVVAGAIYPQFVQRVQVTPNEPEKERPYIERNLEATQAAMGLDPSSIQVAPYQLETDKDAIDLTASEASVRNIRIWDPSDIVLGRTFPQLQRVRDYYRVNDVDVDRYELDGLPTQVVLSVRDLNTAGVPQTSWAARHLTYTHGYGAIVAPANDAGPGGEPRFVGRDIPYVASAPEIELDRPEVYFGEELGSYVVVGTRQRELSYEADDETQFTTYEGADGVPIDNPIKRAAFALRFGDVNPLISDQLTGSSKVLYIRDVTERAKALAPFLRFDADPYPVINEGRVQWILDAYTTTDRYPYGERADTTQLTEGSGLDSSFNYVRNSVKAVVDAYDGTVDFYVMPVEDPIIDAYRDAFPDLFKDFEDMPEGLQSHLRYPEDLFRVQTNMWARYHVTDPDGFYQGNDYWDVARDPGTTGAAEGTQTTDEQGNVIATRDARIEPYYLFTQLPGSDEPSFILVRPFVPTSQRDDNQLLTALMVGQSDGDDYGKLQVFVMPRGNLPKGPSLVQGEIQSDSEVSQTQTLLDGGGSSVQYGALNVIPIDGGLVYVRPFYVTSNQTEVPALQKVIVYFEEEVVIRDSLEEALAEVFSESPPPSEPGEPAEPTEPSEPLDGTLTEQVSSLLADASALFDEADAALRDGDLGTYADKTEEARAKIAQAEQLIEDASGSTTTTTEGASA
jgi:uncharacterized membrane protein (UPF0182 family)